jgi:hypothetical protein
MLSSDPLLDSVRSFWRAHADGHDLDIVCDLHLPGTCRLLCILLAPSAQPNEPNKIVIWMKMAETLCGVIRVWSVVLLEFGKVGEEVIDVSVLWRWGLGGFGELTIHKKTQGWSVIEVARGRTGGKWGRCKIDLWEVLVEANDRVACSRRSGKVPDIGRSQGHVTVIVFQFWKRFTAVRGTQRC